MTSRPWMKFFPRDWRGDQALRAVSLAARGLWMDCLCLMHEAEPRGHLLLNGKKVEVEALARMVGASSEEVSALMAELLSAGVFTQARNGVVTSRRMIRDEKAAKEGSKAVRKRWEQAAEKKEEIDDPNRVVHSPPTDPPSTQKPEARVQKKKEPQQQQPVTRSHGEVVPRGGEAGRVTSSVPSGPADGERDELWRRLRQAGQLEAVRAAWVDRTEPIEALIAEGFDLDRDVLPVVRAKAEAGVAWNSWRFVERIVRDERAAAERGRPGTLDASTIEEQLGRARQVVGSIAAGFGDGEDDDG